MQNKLEMLRIFCTAAESRSFRDAAALLGISPQAVTRAVKELEQQRGEILFYRSTRQMKITADGEHLAKQARLAVNSLDTLFLYKQQQQLDEMRGTIRLTVATALGRRLVMPTLIKFAKGYPDITLDCVLTDLHSDVIDERIDIGIRFGFLPDNRYVAREVSRINFFSVGAPELINRVGVPMHIGELDHFPLTALIDHKTRRYWPWSQKDGRSFTPSNPCFVTDDQESELEAVLSGVGFGYMPGFLVLPYLKDGRLKQILKDNSYSTWGLYLYRPQRGPVSARIRLLFDYLKEALSEIET